jgi:hypothetical protein
MCSRLRGHVQRVLLYFDAEIPCPLNGKMYNNRKVSWMFGRCKTTTTKGHSHRTVVNLRHVIDRSGPNMLAAFDAQMLRKRKV